MSTDNERARLDELEARLRATTAEHGGTLAQRRKALLAWLTDIGESSFTLRCLDNATLDGERMSWARIVVTALTFVRDAAAAHARRPTAAPPSVEALDTVLRLSDARQSEHEAWMLTDTMGGPRGLLVALVELGVGPGAVAAPVRRVLARRVLRVPVYAALLDVRDASRLLTLACSNLRQDTGSGPHAEDDAAFLRWACAEAPPLLRERLTTLPGTTGVLETFFARFFHALSGTDAGDAAQGGTRDPVAEDSGTDAAADGTAEATRTATRTNPDTAANDAEQSPSSPRAVPSVRGAHPPASTAVVEAILRALEAYWRALATAAPRWLLALARALTPALAARLRVSGRNETRALARVFRLVCAVRRHCRAAGRVPTPLPLEILSALRGKLARGYTRLLRDGGLSRRDFVQLDLAADLMAQAAEANVLQAAADKENADEEHAEQGTGRRSTSTDGPPSKRARGVPTASLMSWLREHTSHADLTWLLPLVYVAAGRFGWASGLLTDAPQLIAHVAAVAETTSGDVGLAAVRCIDALARAYLSQIDSDTRVTAVQPTGEEHAAWIRAQGAVLVRLREQHLPEAGRACCYGAAEALAALLPGEVPAATFLALPLNHLRPSPSDVAFLSTVLWSLPVPGKGERAEGAEEGWGEGEGTQRKGGEKCHRETGKQRRL